MPRSPCCLQYAMHDSACIMLQWDFALRVCLWLWVCVHAWLQLCWHACASVQHQPISSAQRPWEIWLYGGVVQVQCGHIKELSVCSSLNHKSLSLAVNFPLYSYSVQSAALYFAWLWLLFWKKHFYVIVSLLSWQNYEFCSSALPVHDNSFVCHQW